MAYPRIILIVVISYLCLTITAAASPSSLVMARTAQGKLRGSWMETYTRKPFLAYRGVRYAEAPMGDYRFKPPVPVKPWGEVVKDALADGPVCPQPWAQDIGPISSEDCLFLNVYTKQLSPSARLPVMVYFHAGGFATLTGNSAWEGPEYLLDHNIVLVTANYRLAALGFVSLGDSLLPGNYGMKDQVEVLKWVRQNIGSFGGDRRLVTIFGYSAGGASVMLHMVSPLSRGLFHRAIAMSGSATSGWTVNRRPQDLAQRLAVNLGCHTKHPGLIYNCLMRHSAEQIVNATIPIKDFPFDPIALFAPVVECGSFSDKFLPADPYELLATGQVAPVPLVTGITRDEFAARGYNVLLNDSLTSHFNSQYYVLAPVEFMYERVGPMSQRVSSDLRRAYLMDQLISNVTRQGFMELYRDALTTFSVVQAAQILSARGSQPVYLYQFSYQGRYSHNYISGTQIPLGIAHHDDLIYLFHISKLFPLFNVTDPDAGMVSTLTHLWTSFAATGVPQLPCESRKWVPLNPARPSHLVITQSPGMCPGLPHSHKMAFWESHFPPVGPHQQNY